MMLIVGFGIAGAAAARGLREGGFGGRIVIIGGEPLAAYDRPALSESVLSGEAAAPQPILPEGWAAAQGIEVRTGVRATRLDTARRELRLDSGDVLHWERLLLATGARARRISVPGCDLTNVHYLRDLADCTPLRAACRPGASLLIVGGGLIGCEVASTATTAGAKVVLLEAAPQLLTRALGAQVGAWCRERLEAKGVAVRLGARLAGLEGRGGKVCAALLADGSNVEADHVLVCVGAEPDVALARDAGIACDGGIVVDARGSTNIEGVFAAGDAARWPLRDGGSRVLETYLNSQAQGLIAAASMLGKGADKAQVLRGWTELAGHRVQIVGDIAGEGVVVQRGDQRLGTPLTLLRVVQDRVLAALSVDAGAEFGVAARLVESATPVSVQALGDPSVRLRDLLRK